MSQEIINIGASANDGQGDPIRTAFAKTNNNFSQLFGIGASQIIYNGTSNVNLPFLNGNVFISVGGVNNVMVVDPTGANINGTLAVTSSVTGGNLLTGGVVSATGTITGANLIADYIEGIVTTASQTQITALGTLTALSVAGNVDAGNVRSSGTVSAAGAVVSAANVSGLNLRTTGIVSATGNITGNYFFGNGSQLTGITSSYSDSNVVTLLSNLGSNTISTTGNISSDYFIGNGSQLTGLAATYSDSNVTTLLSNLGSNTISTTANISGSYFIGNGSQLTDIVSSYSDSNVTTLLSNLGSNTISTTGNISSDYFIGNGSQLTDIVSSYSDSNVTTLLSNLGSNTISTTANISGGYFIGNGSQLTGLASSYSDSNVTTLLSNLGSNTISTTGNISSDYFIGNGSQLTGLASSYSDSNVTTLLSNLGSNTISTTANISGGYFIGNGSQLTDIVSSYSDSNVTTLLSNLGSNAVSTTGNITGANFIGNIIGNGNLYLYPDVGNLSGRLDVFLTTGPDIHVAGVGENLILGRDDGANVTIGVGGNVYVQANTGTAQIWNFDSTGNVSLPDGGNLGTIYGYTALRVGAAGGVFYQNDNSYVGVSPDNSVTVSANSAYWLFGNVTNDGNSVMQLPGGYRIYEPAGNVLNIEAPSGSNGFLINYNNSVSVTIGNTISGNVVSITTTGNTWTFNPDGTVQFPLVSVDALPVATTPGLRAMVYDAINAPTSFGSVLGNAGSNVLPVYSDGTNWRIG